MNSCVVIIFRDLGGFLAEWLNEPTGLMLLLIASAMTWKEEKINFIRRKGRAAISHTIEAILSPYFCSFSFSAKNEIKLNVNCDSKGKEKVATKSSDDPREGGGGQLNEVCSFHEKWQYEPAV